MPLVILAVLVVLLLLQSQQPAPQQPPGYGPGPYGPMPPPGSPGSQYLPPPGAPGAPSSRDQIEGGIGALAGAGVGLYVCGGNPICAGLGAKAGTVLVPIASHTFEAGAKGVAHGAEAAWNSTLGKIF
jgi:hypothetical protein